MRTYYVYIMASRSRVLYTGVTNDLERRTLEHKGRTTPGFTSRYNITRLVYFEELPDVRDAIAREKQIKAWSRGTSAGPRQPRFCSLTSLRSMSSRASARSTRARDLI